MSPPPSVRSRLRHWARTRRHLAQTYRHNLAPPPEAFGSFGTDASLVPPVRVHQPQFMHIGERVTMMDGGFLSAVAGPDGRPPRLVIGDRTHLAQGVTIAAVDHVEIGPACLIGARTFIGDASHAFENPLVPILDQGMTPGRGVVIGEGTFLGIGSVILPGTRIGRGVMVGAASVVSGHVPDHVVVAGNPARIVRRWVEGEGWVRVEP